MTFAARRPRPRPRRDYSKPAPTYNVLPLLGAVRTPTLILYSREDDVPIVEGRILAAGIPNAEFFKLDSKNHVLLDGEPAWKRFCQEVLEFSGVEAAPREAEDPAFAALARREREVLALIAEGYGNARIASQLSISEKTVRNHVSNMFDKLSVWTRAQAIVFARDRGFGNLERRNARY